MSRQAITQLVRTFCLECQGDSGTGVRLCADRQCALWEYRLPRPPVRACSAQNSGEASALSKAAQKRQATRLRAAAQRRVLRAIRRHCLCCASTSTEVRACAAREDCLLWSYRFGVQPETYRAVRQRFLRPKTLSLFESTSKP